MPVLTHESFSEKQRTIEQRRIFAENHISRMIEHFAAMADQSRDGYRICSDADRSKIAADIAAGLVRLFLPPSESLAKLIPNTLYHARQTLKMLIESERVFSADTGGELKGALQLYEKLFEQLEGLRVTLREILKVAPESLGQPAADQGAHDGTA